MLTVLPYKHKTNFYLWHHRGKCPYCNKQADQYIFCKHFRLRINFMTLLKIPTRFFMVCSNCGSDYDTTHAEWVSCKKANFSRPLDIPPEAAAGEYNSKACGLMEAIAETAVWSSIALIYIIGGAAVGIALDDSMTFIMFGLFGLFFLPALGFALSDLVFAVKKHGVYKKQKKSGNIPNIQ